MKIVFDVKTEKYAAYKQMLTSLVIMKSWVRLEIRLCRVRLDILDLTKFANNIGVLQDPFKKHHGVAFEATKFRRLMAQPYPVQLEIIYGQKSVTIDVYEFEPLEAVHVVTWELDSNNEYVAKKTKAAPIALDSKAWTNDHNFWAKNWLDDIVKSRDAMNRFGQSCYEEIDGPLKNLFMLFMKYRPKDEKEVHILNSIIFVWCSN
jgi:hypothetical protein